MSRFLVVGALTGVVLGLAASVLWTHVGIIGVPRLAERQDVAGVLTDASTSGDSTTRAVAHMNTSLAHSTIVNGHAHFLNLELLVIALALLLAHGRLSARIRGLTVGVLFFGALAYPAGLILDGMGFSSAGHGLAFAGSVSTVTIALIAFLGLFRGKANGALLTRQA